MGHAACTCGQCGSVDEQSSCPTVQQDLQGGIPLESPRFDEVDPWNGLTRTCPFENNTAEMTFFFLSPAAQHSAQHSDVVGICWIRLEYVGIHEKMLGINIYPSKQTGFMMTYEMSAFAPGSLNSIRPRCDGSPNTWGALAQQVSAGWCFQHVSTCFKYPSQLWLYWWYDDWWYMMIYDDCWWLMIYDDIWWYMMICDDMWWYLMIHDQIDDIWWYTIRLMRYDNTLWLMIYDDIWWCIMIYDDIWWYMMIYDDIIYDDIWWYMMI